MATIVTVRPNLTSFGKSGTWTVTGAANGQTALSDDSDASYIKKTSTGSGALTYPFGTPTLPGGKAWYRVRPRVRVNMPTDNANITMRIGYYQSAGYYAFEAGWTVTGASGGIVTLTGPWGVGSAAEGMLSLPDLAVMELKDNTSQTANATTFYEAFIDFEWIDPPTITFTSPPATVTDTTRPTVAFTFSQTDGLTQAAGMAGVQDATQYANDDPFTTSEQPVLISGNVLSWAGIYTSDSVVWPYDLPTGETLYARVKVAVQRPSGGYISNGVQGQSASFTISVSPPATPDVLAEFSPTDNDVQVQVWGHTNVLSAQDASFESTGIGGWASDTNATGLARSTAQASTGTASLIFAATANGTVRLKLQNANAHPVLLTCQAFHVVADVRSTVARSVRVGIRWLTAAYATISDSYGVAATDSTTAWTTYRHTAAPPATAVYAVPLVEVAGAVTTDSHYLDKVALAPNPMLTTANRLWNPSFEATVEGWSASVFGYTAGTLAVSATRAQSGTSSALWTLPTAGANGTAVSCQQLQGLVPGQRYTLSLYVYAATGTPTLALMDLFGTSSANSSVVGSTTTKNAWVRLDLSFTATAAVHYVGVKATTASTSGQQVWVDSAQLELGGTLTAYTAPGTLTWTPGGWSLIGHEALVERSDDSGVTWTPVYGGNPLQLDTAQMGSVTDYAAPRGVTSFTPQYRVTHYALDAAQVNVIASTPQTASVTVTNDGLWWWKAPKNPELNLGGVRVLAELPEYDHPEQVGVFRPLGSDHAVVVGGTVQGPDGGMVVYSSGATEQAAVEALVRYADVLVVQDPFGEQRWVRIVDRKHQHAGTPGAPRKVWSVQYVDVAELVG